MSGRTAAGRADGGNTGAIARRNRRRPSRRRSVGRAISRAAPRPAPRTNRYRGTLGPSRGTTSPAPPVRPRRTGPFDVRAPSQRNTRTQRQVRKRRQRDAAAVPSRRTPIRANVPVLRNYTPRQQRTAGRLVQAAVRQQTARDVGTGLHGRSLGTAREGALQSVLRASPGGRRALTQAARAKDARLGRTLVARDAPHLKRDYGRLSERQQAELFRRLDPRPRGAPFRTPKRESGVSRALRHADTAISTSLAPAGILRIPYDTAAGLAQGGTGALGRTAADIAKLPIAAPAALVELALHPRKGVKAIGADYKRRYGNYDPATFRRRIAKEGAAAELLDFVSVAVPQGAVLGRGLGQAARSGSLGRRAKSIATEQRPAKRVSGNKAEQQKLSRNLFRAAAQRGEDRLRTRRTNRRGSDRGARGLQPRPGQRPSGRPAEVVPLAQKRAQRIAASEIQSRRFQRHTQERGREIDRGAMQSLAELHPRQRKAISYVLEGLAIPDNPAAAVRALKAHQRRITRAWQASGRKGVPGEAKLIEEIVADAPRIFDSKMRAFHDREFERAERIGHAGVRSATAEARRFRPQAKLLGIPYPYAAERRAIEQGAKRELRDALDANDAQLVRRKRDQALDDLEARKPDLDAQFVDTVRRTAAAAGHPEPVYLQHFKHRSESEGRSAFATGGRRAAPAPKRTELALFESGRVDRRPVAYTQSLARQIKRKHNWPLVAEQADAHAFPTPTKRELKEAFGHRHVDPEKLTADEWRTLLAHRGLDDRDYALWNPGRFWRHADADVLDPGETLRAVDEAGTVDLKGALGDSLAEAGATVKGTGFKLITREVYDEIHRTVAAGGGLGGRLVDRAQALQSRLLLGTNPTWLQMQVGANTFLSTLGVRGNPAAFVKSPLFWRHVKSLPDGEQLLATLDELYGTGVGQAHGRKVHLGAASDAEWLNRYRATREALGFKVAAGRAHVPLLRKLPTVNPIELMFAADNQQNRYFKRTVLYSKVKRQAFRDMLDAGGTAWAMQDGIADLMKLGPKERMVAIMRDPTKLVEHAKATDDILGNYVRFTAKERLSFKRYVLFYGFLRYAVRTLFYTLPVKHPITMSVAAKLTELRNREVEDLLGGDEAPWALSRVFTDKRKGKLRSVDLARLNPVSSPLADAATEGPKAFGSLISPLAQSVLNQLYGRELYSGRGYRIKGSASEAKEIDGMTRARIFLADMLGTIYPYRLAQRVTQPGTQGDDSLLFSARPIKYKTAEAQQREARRRSRRGSNREELVRQLFPFIPRADDTPIIIQGIQEREGRGKKKSAVPAGGGGAWVVPSESSPSGGAWIVK